MTKQDVISLLRNLHSVVEAEEEGSAEHITEWMSSDEVQEAIDFLEAE
jgi:hypothetical protein